MKQTRFLKSPLNYIGGKYKLLSQIMPLFPTNISTFVDLFCGGCNVAINVEAKKILCNDNLIYLIELLEFLQSNSIQSTLEQTQETIKKYTLNKTNENGYYALRNDYNKKKSPIFLLCLIAFCFNHQIRFNNSHHFNNPFGKNKSSFNDTMKNNLIAFIKTIQEKEIHFSKLEFTKALENIPQKSFVYADPPYLITQSTYNDGKRGFSGWNEYLEQKLLYSLDELNSQNIYFALSNVLYHKQNENKILKKWIQSRKYTIHNIDSHYTNANYQTKYKDKNQTQEVLITNY